MIPFLNIFNIQRADNSQCIQANLTVKIISNNLYSAYFSTRCAITVRKYGFSRLIFDKTAIESLGYSFFDFGILETDDALNSPISKTLQNFRQQNFIMGMQSFYIPAGQTKLVFYSERNDTFAASSTMSQMGLKWSYFSLRYRECPPLFPLFSLQQMLCYSECPLFSYLQTATTTCRRCHYSCYACDGIQQNRCTSCNETWNREMSNGSCTPMQGFFDNGTSQAIPCNDSLPECLQCHNSSVCVQECAVGSTYSQGQCVPCPNSISQCPTCSVEANCFVCAQLLVDRGAQGWDCVHCGLTGCQWCLGEGVCGGCLSGWVLNQGQCQQQPNEPEEPEEQPRERCPGVQLAGTVPLLDYSWDCALLNFFQGLAKAMMGLSLGLAIASIATVSLLGLQLVGAIQLSFLCLSMHPQLHPFMSPLLSWVYSNGYNLLTQREDGNDSITAMSYSIGFAANLNIMLLILIVSAFFVLILRLWIKNKKNKTKNEKTFLKTVLKITNTLYITLLIFNTYNVFFCVGLHISGNSKVDALDTAALIVSVILYFISVIFLFFQDKRLRSWGHYWSCLKNDTLSEFYIPFTVIYRSFLAFYVGYCHMLTQTPLLGILFPMGFCLLSIITCPYNKWYHNYRAILCHICNIITVFCALYYQEMTKHRSLIERFNKNDVALLHILSLLVCLFFSWAIFIKEIVVEGIKLFKKSKAKNEIINQDIDVKNQIAILKNQVNLTTQDMKQPL